MPTCHSWQLLLVPAGPIAGQAPAEEGRGRLSQPHYRCRPTANDVYFNTCLPKSSDAKLDFELDNYTLMAHEVGHALGLSNSAASLDYLTLTRAAGYVISHPTIHDSVLNNDSRVRRDLAEPDCAPYPVDVMAIYALYQNVP